MLNFSGRKEITIDLHYPTVKFCNEYITCKSCPYHYDEDVKKENQNDRFQ